MNVKLLFKVPNRKQLTWGIDRYRKGTEYNEPSRRFIEGLICGTLGTLLLNKHITIEEYRELDKYYTNIIAKLWK